MAMSKEHQAILRNQRVHLVEVDIEHGLLNHLSETITGEQREAIDAVSLNHRYYGLNKCRIYGLKLLII